MLGVATVGVISRSSNEPGMNLDFLMFCAVIAFVAWCLWPSSKDDAEK